MTDHRRAWPRDRERRPDSSVDGQVFLALLLREIDPGLHRGDEDGQTVGWARFRIARRDLELVLDHTFRATPLAVDDLYAKTWLFFAIGYLRQSSSEVRVIPSFTLSFNFASRPR